MMKKLLLLLFVMAININYSQNNYLDLDGIDDYIEISNSGTILSNAAAITMSCKVFPTRVSSGFPDFNGILGYRNEIDFDFYLIQLSSTDVEARFRNSNGVAYTITYTGLVLNQWNQFFLVYDGASSSLNLYSGGILVGSTYADGVAGGSSADYLKIGNITFQSFEWYHQGYIDEVSLWNKALTASEISNITVNSGEIANPLSETNLKLYYKFNQGIAYGDNSAEIILNDEMGQQNGLLHNFALTGTSSNWGGAALSNAAFTKTSVQLYPNPAAEFVSVSGLKGAAEIKIIDITGRVVSAPDQQAAELARIDVSHLKSGVYFMVINNEQKIKFVKK